MRALLAGLRNAGFDYRCFHVMRLDLRAPVVGTEVPHDLAFAPVTEADVRASADEAIRETAWYGGSGADGFALARGRRIVCLQWLWHGERARERAFWPLRPMDAVSMHLVTVDDERGHGHATTLKRLSALAMQGRGFTALYSRIWWTNVASLRVSEKAGWQRVGTTLALQVPGRDRPFEWRRPREGR
jgi:hypothetical protein